MRRVTEQMRRVRRVRRREGSGRRDRRRRRGRGGRRGEGAEARSEEAWGNGERGKRTAEVGGGWFYSTVSLFGRRTRGKLWRSSGEALEKWKKEEAGKQKLCFVCEREEQRELGNRQNCAPATNSELDPESRPAGGR